MKDEKPWKNKDMGKIIIEEMERIYEKEIENMKIHEIKIIYIDRGDSSE